MLAFKSSHDEVDVVFETWGFKFVHRQISKISVIRSSTKNRAEKMSMVSFGPL